MKQTLLLIACTALISCVKDYPKRICTYAGETVLRISDFRDKKGFGEIYYELQDTDGDMRTVSVYPLDHQYKEGEIIKPCEK